MDIKLNMVLRICGGFFLSCFLFVQWMQTLRKSGWPEDCLITFFWSRIPCFLLSVAIVSPVSLSQHFPPQLWDVWQRRAENGGCAEGQPAGSASCACRAAGTQLLPKALTPLRCSVVPIRSFDHFRALKKISCSVLAHVATFYVKRTFLYSPL